MGERLRHKAIARIKPSFTSSRLGSSKPAKAHLAHKRARHVATLLALFFLLPSVVIHGATAGAEDLLTREPNDMPLLAPVPWALIDLILLPEEGRGIQVFSKYPNSRLMEFDLETYQLRREAIFPNFIYQVKPDFRSYDYAGKRVWMLNRVNVNDLDGGRVVEISLDTLQITRTWTDNLGLWRGLAWVGTPKGFDVYVPPSGPPKFYFQWSRSVFLQTGDDLIAGNPLTVSQVSSTNADDQPADWAVPVRACTQANLTLGGAVFRSRVEDAVYVFCKTGNHVAQIVRLSLGKGGDPLKTPTGDPTQPIEAAFPGPAELAPVPWADPDGNRMFIATSGSALWVFDGTAAGYVGVIGMKGGNPMVERRSGGIYQFVPQSGSSVAGGIYFTNGRTTPPAQFEPYQQFRLPGAGIVGAYPPSANKPGRIYLLPQNARSAWVIKDTHLVVEKVDRLNDTGRTQDIPEKEGVTEVDYSGASKGYGLRALLVSGPEGLLPGTTAADIAVVRGPSRVAGSPCTKSNREVSFGRVRQAELSTLVASASSLSADADATTRSDLGSPAQSCWPIPGQMASADFVTPIVAPFFPKQPQCNKDGAPQPPNSAPAPGNYNCLQDVDDEVGQNWDTHYPETVCGTSRTYWQDQDFKSTAAGVGCGSSVTATATHGFDVTQTSALPTGAVTVAEAGSSTTITRDKDKGIVTTTISWARGITIAGIGAIDEVWARAESWANGRPGKAGTSYRARACGFRQLTQPADNTNGFSGTGTKQGDGGGPGCDDPKKVADAIKSALGSRGTAKGPQIDAELAEGSPRGYQAAIQKDLVAQLSSKALNNDESTEAPALEIVIWDDSGATGRARQVYQLAGLEAASQYGISKLPDTLDELFEDIPPTPDEYETFGGDAGVTDSSQDQDPSLVAGESADFFGSVGKALTRVVEKLFDGIRLALRTPGKAFAVWAAIGLPAYLALRRRCLVRSIGPAV